MKDGFTYGSGDDAAQEISSLGKKGLKSLLDSVDTFIFDCDGVIWFVDHVFPEAPKLISLLRKLGKKVCFITNNTLRTHEQHLAKFRRLGIHVEEDEFVFPVQSLCHYLQGIQFKGKIEYSGDPAARNEVRAQGFDVIDDKEASTIMPTDTEFLKVALVQEPISAAIVDLDMNVNLLKISRIVHILNSNPDCLYLTVCADNVLPIAPTLKTAGPGATIRIIKDLTGKEPKALGKPGSGMFEVLKKRLSLDPKRTIFVGDSIDADIGMAKNCNIRSILVLSGATRREFIPFDDPLKKPTYISEGVCELLSLIDELVFPVQFLCQHLKEIQFKGKIEYLGCSPARKELLSRGFDLNDDELPLSTVDEETDFIKLTLSTEPTSAVVVDVDLKSSFLKVARVVHIFQRNPNCLYFAAAVDKKHPFTRTLTGPGPGYVTTMVEELTGRKPEVVGKPSTKMFEFLKQRFSLDPEKTIFIGDSIETDIIMAKHCGIRSILVLTGSAQREHVPDNDPSRRPSYICEGVAELYDLIETLQPGNTV